MKTLRLCFFILIGLFSVGSSAPAQEQDTASPTQAQATPAANEEDSSPYSEAELISEVAWIQPGTPFVVALRMQMEEGWHSYWKNPGDSGQPTSIDWALPPRFAAGDIQWPYPHRIEADPLVSYGYSDEVLLLTEITPPNDLAPDTSVTLAGRASWLICADICLTAEAEVDLTVPVRAEPPAPSEQHAAIATAQAQLPQQLPDWDVRATEDAGSYVLTVTPPEAREMEGAHFFSSARATLAHAAPQPISQEGDTYHIALQRSEYAQESAERLEGVLVAPDGQTWDATGDVRALAVDVPVEETQAMAASSDASGASMSLFWALLFAFAGGLILNLMPCVFPILSFKVLGFAQQADAEAAQTRGHGLVFGAGVVASFWVLAGVLIALRAGGSQIGWGFQLQSPIFIALMALLFFGIGLNLLGVFEVGSRLMNWGGRVQDASAGHSYSGSFLSGVLATVVATPCTAPLMGAALGFAITLPAAGTLLIFTALGVGMAAPYVALSMAPRLLQRLPKPGPWMETLRHLLAFPMFATTIWLVWVFGQQAGINGVAFLLFGLLLLGVTAWILGRWTAYRISPRVRLVTRSLALAVFAGALAASLIGAGYEGATTSTAASDAENDWQTFAPEKVEQLRAEGQPVFVDFTAAWCLTCQVNKRTTLTADAVRRAFEEKNVALLKADWTNRDSVITRALESHGRNGVPLYVLYKGDGSEPTLLPEILTESIVLSTLDDLPDGGVASEGPS